MRRIGYARISTDDQTLDLQRDALKRAKCRPVYEERASGKLTERIETRSPAGRLVFHVFAALAEFERNLIWARTFAGLKAARARGRKGGRPPKLNPKDLKTIRTLLRTERPVSEIAARFAARRVNFSTFMTQVHDIFESGHRVVVRVTHQATGKGPYRFRIGTYNVSGKTLRWDAIVIFRFQNRSIAEECSRNRRKPRYYRPKTLF